MLSFLSKLCFVVSVYVWVLSAGGPASPVVAIVRYTSICASL